MMRKTTLLMIIILIGLLAAACSQSEEAPAPPPPAATDAPPPPTVEPEVVEEVAPATDTPEPVVEEEAEQAEESAADAEETEEVEAESAVTETAIEEPAKEAIPASGPISFQIVPERSEARFFIDEVLLGSDKTVVGVTSQIVGQVEIDPANLANSQISPIQINARDLTTDDNRRNGALQRRILQSDQDAYQFITFEPTAIEGLPEAITVGETVEFNVTGNLTVRDVTQAETFAMVVTVNAENEVVGLGSTTILYKDYGISIPSVPAVASVEDEVRLELEFTAVAPE